MLLDDIRTACAAVAARSELVRIDVDGLRRLAGTIDPEPPEVYPEERWDGPTEQRAMAVLGWNAVNFGSGWFPHVTKIPGLSGARTLATRWQQRCGHHGVPRAAWFARVGSAEVAEVFEQPPDGEAAGLIDAFTVAWNELGSHLLDRHGGRAWTMVEAAGGSGAALAEELATLPTWDDRHRYGDLDVPLHKRAQIVVSALATTLDEPLARFGDLDRLTAFADNLVPHVLKLRGVLVVDPSLDARIERGELLVSGEAAEVELRAVAVHAVELLVAELQAAGHHGVTAAGVDHRLWQLGQDPAIKARPRHRCRCTYY